MAQEPIELHHVTPYQALVCDVGNKVITGSVAKDAPYNYEFHLFTDKTTINTFVLLRGRLFQNQILFSKLENEDQTAGVVGYNISHVLVKYYTEDTINGNF